MIHAAVGVRDVFVAKGATKGKAAMPAKPGFRPAGLSLLGALDAGAFDVVEV